MSETPPPLAPPAAEPSSEGRAPAPALAARLGRMLRDFRAYARGNAFELFTAGGAVVALGLFAAGSLDPDGRSGIGGPIAKLVAGEAERKASGSKAFVSVAAGAELHALDAIWTGKGRSAVLALAGGTSVVMGERTLLVLKQPFRRRFNLPFEEQVHVISGDVKLGGDLGVAGAGSKRLSAADPASRPQETPAALPQGLKIFPPPEALLYYRTSGTVELKLTWEKDLAGYLRIITPDGGEVSFMPVEGGRFATVALRNGLRYQWSVIDEQKAVLLGPFDFELRPLNEAVAAELVKHPPTRPLFVYW